MLSRTLNSDFQVLVERGAKNIFDLEDEALYTNYWYPMKDQLGDYIGVIGMQLDMALYNEMIPSPVIE